MAAAAANRNLKRVTLELGGKSPLIIFPDCDRKLYSFLNLLGGICSYFLKIYLLDTTYKLNVHGHLEVVMEFF